MQILKVTNFGNPLIRCAAVLVFSALVAPGGVLAAAVSDAQQAQIQSAYEESRQALREDRIAEALASAKRAFELAKTAYGPTDPTTIKLQQNYGTFLVLVGSRTDAFRMLNEALEAIGQTYGADAYESVAVLVTLGEILRNDAQLHAVQRALALQKKHHPDDVLAYADVAKRTGRYLATSRGQNQHAIPILQEALDIYTTEYGRNGEELIPVLMSLGDAHASFGRSQKQKSAYRRALSLAKKTGDPLRHADLLHTAGVHLMQLSASPDARKYLVKAHEIFAEQLGSDHFKTGNALLSLGRFHVASQRYSRAEPKLLAALDVFEKNDNFRNYELLTLSLLVETYEEMGERDAATPFCQMIGQVTPWTEDQEYRPIYKRAPTYPENAVKSGINGHVILEYSVDENGLVQSPVVVDLKGPDSFIPAAMTSVATFRYAPRYVDGKPVLTPGVKNKFVFTIK